MHKILYVLLAMSMLFAAQDNVTDKKNKTEKSIKSNEELEKKINKKLDELASDILKGEEQIQTTSQQIEILSKQVSELEKSSKTASLELDSLILKNSQLINKQQEIENNILQIISKEFAYDLIAPQNYSESEDSIIIEEILKELSKNAKNEVQILSKDYSKTINLIKTQSNKIEDIKTGIADFKNKQNTLLVLQNKQSKDLASLRADKLNYQKRLETLGKEQKELRTTLEKLLIVQNNPPATQTPKSTKIQNTYKMGDVKTYTGQKTIAPLEKFSIKQSFGMYTDRIYNIKIFNESVILRSATADAVVKNVLDGKVVFAKDTPLLEKVVIVENEAGIHTIYAHLSKIAPTIKVGARIKKGYVIGRVARDLTFEVTQQNYHINPMELIASK